MYFLLIIFYVYGLTGDISANLNLKCYRDDDCTAYVSNSQCKDDHCSCRDYYVEYNNNTCLESHLLGSECILNEQCANKVAYSTCLDRVCECDQHFIPFRRHSCLAPSKPGEVCFSDEQCKVGNSDSICNFLIPNIFGRCQCKKPFKRVGNNCLMTDTDSLSPITTISSPVQHVDTSATETKETNIKMRERNYMGQEAVSLGYQCVSDLQCQLSDMNSRCVLGICDCSYTSNSRDSCTAATRGCRPDTFQCINSGQCISSFFVCDNHPDCFDKSDELCKSNCPSVTFSCSQEGPCVSFARRCDGKRDCPNGEDEQDCQITTNNGRCPVKTFQCSNGQCIPEFKFCNAVVDCKDGSDENKNVCRGKIRTDYCPLRCKNGRCRSSAIACSGLDGCGDLTDELNCSICRCGNPDQMDMIKTSINTSSSI